MSNYEFKLIECDKRGVPLSTATEKNLEVDFEGLKYLRAEGMDNIGEARVYTEEYADSERMRVHIPTELTNKQTEVTFTFVFLGDNRRSTLDEFLDYVRHGFHRYYDTARKKYLYFYVASAVEIEEEKWDGSLPYIELKLVVNNIYGKTFSTPIQ